MIRDWMESIKRLAAESTEDFPLWTIILCIVVFGVFGLVFDYLTHYVIREHMIEYGYGKKKQKKKNCSQSVLEKALLVKTYKEAPRRGGYLLFCWILNMFACFGAAVEIFAICCSIATRCQAWTILLMIVSGFGVFVFWGFVDFIPSIIYLPSERARYKR